MTADETPVFIPCGGDAVFGILTRGKEPRRGVTALQLWGYASTPTSGKNRIRTRLAHALADIGYDSLRIDYRGAGDSTGELGPVRLDAPLVDEGKAAIAWLRERGSDRVALIGYCFGTRVALHVAAACSEVETLVLLGSPTTDESYEERTSRRSAASLLRQRGGWSAAVRRLASSRDRRAAVRVARAKAQAMIRPRLQGRSSPDGAPMSAAFLAPLAELAGRGVSVLFVYGEHDEFYRDFERARARSNAIALSGSFQVCVLGEGAKLHDPSVRSQSMMFQETVAWLAGSPGGDGSARAPRLS